MGLGTLNPTVSIPYPIVPMFVETFGGGVYHVCDGGDTFGFGEQIAGYPGWDPNTGLFLFNPFLFNLDLSKFLGKTVTLTMPASGQFQSAPNDLNQGTVSYSGTLTFSTTAPAAACDPATESCPAG